MKNILCTLALLVSFSSFGQTAVDYLLSGIEKGDKNDPYGAISDYTKAIEKDPNYEGAYRMRGITKESVGDYYGAISDYTKAIEIDPNSEGAYRMRGLSKKSVGDIYGAISDFKKALNISPNDPESAHYNYDNMAACMMNLKDYEGAYYAFKKAIEINPDYANAYYNLGIVKWNLNYALADCCKSWREAAYRGHEMLKND